MGMGSQKVSRRNSSTELAASVPCMPVATRPAVSAASSAPSPPGVGTIEPSALPVRETTAMPAMAACVQAFRGSVAIAAIAVVYLTGSALGSIVPTPGGLGAVEAALTAGLVATGMHGTEAASSVLLFRLLTFWLPIPIGWVALNYLERKDAL